MTRVNTDRLIRSQRRRVLIVEDEAVNRELLGFILQDSYDILYAENGRDALAIMREQKDRLSMVLLDINMPVMNGIELLQVLREDKPLRKIPVIVLTSDKDAELEAFRLGALDFIMKPYDMPEIILARVKRIIEFVEDREIIKDVERDDLTDLYTRGFFHEYCRRLLTRDENQTWDMIAIDVDHFRLINEVYGKAYGDEVLRAIADGIRHTLDISFGISCRSDADLFFLFANHAANYQAMYDRVAEALRRVGGRTNVRIRMGVYPNVTSEHTIEWYSVAAKSACSAIRNNFARSIMVYDETLHQQELYRERLINDMDRAIREKQFKVVYQPKYDVRGSEPRLYSAEALVRWQHPELGFISPGAFIPLFEENGLILKLDDYVWREAAAQTRRWRESYGVDIPISVNLSRVDFFDMRLKERLLGIVAEAGIGVRDIVLEVTESAYSQNVDQMLKMVSDLRGAGFQIEMDDFGSGYSSLNMLCVMPIDAIKIDMKFVRNIMSARSGYRMVELVVEMARSLEIPAIVEGVEDEAQYRLMKQAGCDIVQGYYFSKPVDAETFEQFIRRT